ncbi:hypothetical protein [Hansschlegelia plantiphila]|uniref:Uncharacterized protein n=1 Tax=Hansschlegelia plantiphila TaxID=374655 RepID=A0A9W6J2K9_9HYPH|nr:hypothetical protein [Hansschlegelia plantiphila]GLK69527.1 hypothetical protein GCM10008179_31650 [Hansschlegelia plantiphila]
MSEDDGELKEMRVESIDAVFRNGSITAFGIVVSFSLNFLAQWAASPGVWHTYDTPPVAAMFIGITLQIRALALLLPIEGLHKTVYDKATRLFLWGLVLTGLGVFSAVALDAGSAFFLGLK